MYNMIDASQGSILRPFSLELYNNSVKPKAVVKTLGATLNTKASLDSHV